MAGSLHRESGDLSRDGDRQCLQAPFSGFAISCWQVPRGGGGQWERHFSHLGHQASPTSLSRRIGVAICMRAALDASTQRPRRRDAKNQSTSTGWARSLFRYVSRL